MDEKYIEMAEQFAENQRAGMQAKASEKAIPTADLSPEEYIRTDCAGCGDDLPEFRMKKGLIKCVTCQNRQERSESRFK